MKKRLTSWLLVLSFLLASELSCLAENYKLDDDMSIEVNAYSRTRYEVENWYGTDKQERNYKFPSEKAKLGAVFKKGNWSVGAEGQYYAIWNVNGSEPGAAGSFYNSNGKDNDPDDFSLRKAFAAYQEKDVFGVTVGRQAYNSGTEGKLTNKDLAFIRDQRVAQRLIGATEFTGGRSFDGVRGEVSGYNDDVFTALLTHPTQGGNDTNNTKEINDIDIGSLSWTKLFKDVDREAGQAQLFYYYYGDRRGLVKTDNRPEAIKSADLDNISIHTFGGHSIYQIKVPYGMLDTLAWGALQFGDWGDQTQQAWAGIAEGGYKLTDFPWTPWFRIGYNTTSGDGNTTDSKHKTFSQLIPTPRNFALTPFYNMQNLNDVFAAFIVSPTEKLSFRTEFHNLSLNNNRDLLYSGGGAPNTSSFGYNGVASNSHYDVANVLDLGTSYTISPNFKVEGYISHVWGGDVLQSNFSSGSSDISYGFMDLVMTF